MEERTTTVDLTETEMKFILRMLEKADMRDIPANSHVGLKIDTALMEILAR
jgi:hypothetical protein